MIEKKKRRIKPLKDRKPKQSLSHSKLITDIAKDLGFSRANVLEVIHEFEKRITDGLLEGKKVLIPKIGILFPAVRPSRPATKLNGGVGKPEVYMAEPFWMVRYTMSRDLKIRINKNPVTEADVETIYYKD